MNVYIVGVKRVCLLFLASVKKQGSSCVCVICEWKPTLLFCSQLEPSWLVGCFWDVSLNIFLIWLNKQNAFL